MSGPNDSGSDGSAGGDFKLTLPEIGAPTTPSDRFKLKVAWQTPHLEWRPIKGSDAAQPGSSTPPPSDPEAAVNATDRYFKGSQLLFDLGRPNWDLVDKSFLSMPTDKPVLLPTLGQIKAWEDDVFLRGLGREPPLIGAPAASPLLMPGYLTQASPSPFYKLPDPAAMNRDGGPPRAGAVGDVLKGIYGLPFTQRLVLQAHDEAKRQFYWLMKEWHNMSAWNRVEAITLSSALVAGVVGTVIGVDDVRHVAFKSLLGVDLPVPFAPGFSIKINGYGPTAAARALLGPPSTPGAAQPGQGYNFMVTVDVPNAIKTIGKFFR